MKSIEEIQKEIIEEFAVYDEWLDKYEYLIDLGREMPLVEEAGKTDANLIEGCQSRVWLTCSQDADGRLHFKADSDAIITKGIISLLIRVFDGQTPQDILSADLHFIDAIGLRENLSPTRAGGLAAMIKRIRDIAQKYAEGGKKTKTALEANIVMALRQVYDPEIPVNVYDLGLIYEIAVDEDHKVDIKMTLTAPNCPIADVVVESVAEAVRDVPGVVDVAIELVFEPAWSKDMMSEEAKIELGLE
jgi:cysteine desulfuration protein SufE